MMTGRSLPEWIGASPDSAIPPRVKLRLFEAAGCKCQICGRALFGGDEWEADHIIALKNGGENRERNLQVACEWCHPEKTKADVAEKAAVYRKRVKDTGAAKPKSRFPNSRDGHLKTRLTSQGQRTGPR